MKEIKIAIICNDDKLWSLYAWNKTFKSKVFQGDFSCKAFWTCDNKLGNIKPNEVLKWYMGTFGKGNFLKLAMFTVLFKLNAIFKYLFDGYCLSFKSLSQKYNVPHYATSGPNDPQFIKWLKDNDIDVLIIMVGHILKHEVLAAPNMCVINKHASLLPSNKGVFPYFWAQLNQSPQGVSFHKVNEKIDEGDLVYQERVENTEHLKSMISFYFYVYKNYDKMLAKSLQNIKNNVSIPYPENIPSNYYGFPDHSDYKKFRNQGANIITLTDLFLTFKQ